MDRQPGNGDILNERKTLFLQALKADSYHDGVVWQWLGWSLGLGGLCGKRQEKERERSHLFSWREIKTEGGRREASEGALICLGAAVCASSALTAPGLALFDM